MESVMGGITDCRYKGIERRPIPVGNRLFVFAVSIRKRFENEKFKIKVGPRHH